MIRAISQRGLLVSFLILILSAGCAQPLVFQAGDRVLVSAFALRVRAEAGLGADVLGEQTLNAQGTVRGEAPEYRDGFWWWPVDYDSGVDGWSAAGSGGILFLNEATAHNAVVNRMTGADTAPQKRLTALRKVKQTVDRFLRALL